MSKTYIPKSLRAKVRANSAKRCSYCLSAEENLGILLDFEHIIPEASGGLTDEQNLCLACGSCNSHKNAKGTGVDLISGERVNLFHPHQQKWSEHFKWSDDGAVIIGLSTIGRATIEALNMNHSEIVTTRRRWVSVGWHPPKD